MLFCGVDSAVKLSNLRLSWRQPRESGDHVLVELHKASQLFLKLVFASIAPGREILWAFNGQSSRARLHVKTDFKDFYVCICRFISRCYAIQAQENQGTYRAPSLLYRWVSRCDVSRMSLGLCSGNSRINSSPTSFILSTRGRQLSTSSRKVWKTELHNYAFHYKNNMLCTGT